MHIESSALKVLIVCNGNKVNTKEDFKTKQPFIYEQIKSLEMLGVIFDIFLIKGKGISGYLRNYSSLKKYVKQMRPDLIHAHYGLSGLLANLQRSVPVITTFHGSDINVWNNRIYSWFAAFLSRDNIFVNINMPAKIKYKRKINIIPCGVDSKMFFPVDMKKARTEVGLNEHSKYALFSSSFDNKIKNYQLALSSIESASTCIELLELKNRSRQDVNLLLNSVDLLIMTSFSEGSPQIIKEAMLCNCPILSVDVGDVKSVFGDVEKCFIVPYDAKKIGYDIDLIVKNKNKTNGREAVMKFSLESIASNIYQVYVRALEK
jgi:teichuronic acid biosynthesis glycosyltransferase TuaC